MAMLDRNALNDQTSQAWCSSQGSEHWIVKTEVKVSIDDIGFRQGVIAVERLRTYRQIPFEIERHWSRWVRTLDCLRIEEIPDRNQWFDLNEELLTRNKGEIHDDVGIVWLATPGLRLGSPTIILHLQSLDLKRIEQRRTYGQPITVTDVRQPPAESWPREIKVRNRLHYYLADHQASCLASQSGMKLDLALDPSGFLVDGDGGITESSVSNLAIVKEGRISSPPRTAVLPGVTQAVIEQLARSLGLSWEIRTISPEELKQSDEVLLMGTDTGLWFASHIDAVALPVERPVFQVLKRRFDEYCRVSRVPGSSDEN